MEGGRGAGHAHDLPSHICKPCNLRFTFNRQVTKPAGNTVSQDRLYARPVENQHDIRTNSKQPQSTKKV